MGILQSKQPRSGMRSDNGKIHEGSQEIETVSQCLPEIWTMKGMTSYDHNPHVALRGATDFQQRNSPIMWIQDITEQLQHTGESSFLKLQALDTDLCSAFLPTQEEVAQTYCKEATSSVTHTVPSEPISHADPSSMHRESQGDTELGVDDTRSFGASRLLFHITDGDNPLLSPRCSIFSQSQRFNLDPESAPSPPSTQQFMMPRSSSRGNCADPKEPLTVIQLTKQIQNLKKKIRKFEDKFELERNYRPSHSDKTSNLECLKWMNDLAKARKQLKELKLKLSEDQNVQRGSQSVDEERPVSSMVVDQNGASSSAMSSVEETVETVWKRLKEKRQLLNLPEHIKDMTKKQMHLEKMSLQKCLLYFENIHGRPVTKQERSLMKPLYDRYRILKQLLSTASLIPTIHEEEDSDDDSAQNSSSEFVLTEGMGDSTADEHLVYCGEDIEPAYISPLDEKRPSRQPALSMSNLHEASMPELLDHLRETRADKKRLRKALREFEEHFLRQTGRSAQKEDKIPMAEEYCEYKQIKAKLRLLEVLISKQDVAKTI